MGHVTVPQMTDGTTHTAAQHNNQVNPIANEVNGNLDDTNIKAGAAIDVSKLAQNNGQLAIKPVIASKFRAYIAGIQSITNNTPTKIAIDTKNYDTSSNFDAVTNHRFTAPVAGTYTFKGRARAGTGSITHSWIALYVNGSLASYGDQLYGTGFHAPNVADDLQLAINDYVELWCLFEGATANIAAASAETYFSGHLVSA